MPLFLPDQSIQIKRGDRQSGFLVVATTDSQGVTVPLDLSSYHFELRIGGGFGSPRWLTLTSDPSAGLTVPTPSNGEVHYDLSPTMTLMCQQGAAVYELKLYGSDNIPTTILSGQGVVMDELR